MANLANPWLFARLLASIAVAVLGAYALTVAFRVLRVVPSGRAGAAALGASGEAMLRVERRAELAATIMQLGLVVGLFDLVLLVVAADRLSASIRGAMCAYGVFGSSDFGWPALGASVAAASGCALWLALHRFDLTLEQPWLLRAKFGALFVVVPLVFLDAMVFLAFSLDLDFQIIASCCSVALDEAGAGFSAMQSGPARNGAVIAAVFTATLAAVAALVARRRGPFAYAAGVASVAAAASAVPAVLWYVAPHAYETPHHLCPFCLLRGEAFGLGYPLFGAMLLGLVGGVALVVVHGASRRAARLAGGGFGEVDPAAQRLRGRLGAMTAVSWTLAVILGAVPVVRYLWQTGGTSVFG